MTAIRYGQHVLCGALADTVDPRDIWKFLGAVEPYEDWIRARIPDFGFREGMDFCVVEGPTPTYAVSLHMAEQLIVAEPNAKGARAWDWVVDFKKWFRAKMKNNALGVPASEFEQFINSPRQALEYLMKQAEGPDAGSTEAAVSIEPQAPNPEEPDTGERPEGYSSVAEVAQRLGYTEAELVDLMVQNGFAYWRADDGVLLPTQAAVDAGLLARM